jgi:iron(III) transport system permease protein
VSRARGIELPRLATAVVLAGLVGAPFLFIVLQSIFPQIAEGSFAHPFAALGALVDPMVVPLAGHTLALGCCVALASAALGVPLGAMRGLLRVRFARAADAALFTPFMIPPYLSTLGWILLLQPHGWLERAIGVNFGRFLFSFVGVVFVMTLNLFPIVYFATSRSMAASGGRLTDVARLFGATQARAFRRIALPLAAPAVASALVLVFSATIDEFGAPAALLGESHFSVLVTAIDSRVSDAPVDLPGAASLALLLTLMGLAAYLLQEQILGRRSYETILGKPRAHVDRPAGRAAPLLTGLLLAVALLSAGTPLSSIAAAAFARTVSGGLSPSNLGLTHFRAILSDADGALSALLASLGLGLATAFVTAAIGLAAAVFGRRAGACRDALGRAIAVLTVLPNATPGVVVAVGMILFWNQPSLPATFYGGWSMLVVAYSCLLLPYPARYAASALRQIGSNLEPAARVAGAGPLAVLRRVTLPLLAPSLIAAMMLVFAIASRELVASILLVPTGGDTIATYIWRQVEQGSLGDAMAMSLVAILVTATALAIVSLRRPPGERSDDLGRPGS